MSALVVLDPEVAPVWARSTASRPTRWPSWPRDPEVVAEIDAGLAEVMAGFNNAERVKKVTVLGEEWLPDSDVLTPTSKLKRRGVLARYARRDRGPLHVRSGRGLLLPRAAADVYVPDGAAIDDALARTTDLGIVAHQDDLEFMALVAIGACLDDPARWFSGVACTDGARQRAIRSVRGLHRRGDGRAAED